MSHRDPSRAVIAALASMLGQVACQPSPKGAPAVVTTGVTTPGPAPCGALACDTPIDVTVGGNHACAVRADGTVWCWGSNTFGQLGDSTRTSSSRPRKVVGVSDAVQLAAGDQFTCARRRGGAVACWGRNWFGELGTAQTRLSTRPQAVPEIDNAVALVAGHAHACVIRRGGSVVCWGANSSLESAPTSSLPRVAPMTVAGITNAHELAAGGELTCALDDGGALRCWGAGGVVPAALLFPPPVHAPVLSTSGLCVRKKDDALECTGVADKVATQFPSGEVAFEGDKLCGSTASGSLGCWEYNKVSTVARTTHLTRIVGGVRSACGLDVDRVVWCWGANLQGQLGDGSIADRSNAVRVEGLR